ncbi:VPLPA-CTERM sorting domain-containing protein [Tropicimonas sediminicola]|uniref:VPLPA-CTERM protein sorting domain-containing protein n=1 Tax=Tropicimonas sediminicola TaxID=1031541 RepID=A0A239I0W2_9RHOB|nr:VPLPA-CTERM sorting domain-containing protein [Tropicimonas sediminicola]SNS86064.1 VPLPA-CTERM protein sorting domain-containing protein [Tropicimonas sediminicola]
MSWTPGPFGYPGDYKWDTFKTRANLSGGQATAGAFELTATLPDTSSFDFTAFSLDLEKPLIANQQYTVTNWPFSNGGVDLTDQQETAIQALFDIADPMSLDFTTNEIYSSGFQLALYEVVYETSGNPYTLAFESSGTTTFYAEPTDYSDTGEVGAVAFANSILSTLNSGTGWVSGAYELFWLQNTNNVGENLVSGYTVGSNPGFPAAPIPLPASGLLLIGGLGALAVARRRRKVA